MELQYKNSEKELFSFYKYIRNNEKILKKYRCVKTFIMIPITLIISIFMLYTRLDLIEIHGQVTPEDILIIVTPIFFGVVWSTMYHIISKLLDRDKFEGEIKNMDLNLEEDEITLKVAKDGLEYLIDGSEAIYYWKSIKEVIKEKELIYILFNYNCGIVVPANAFKEEKDRMEFLEEINKNRNVKL